MKKYYYVISETENGKNYAFASTVDDSNNLLAIFRKYKHATIIHPCESRTKAEYIAAEWNESYKANGTYLFD